MSIQSDAEMENFGHLHLEYRFGYHFIAHGRLSRKNFLGTLKGAPQKWSIWEDPKIVFIQFYRSKFVKTPTNYIYFK